MILLNASQYSGAYSSIWFSRDGDLEQRECWHRTDSADFEGSVGVNVGALCWRQFVHWQVRNVNDAGLFNVYPGASRRIQQHHNLDPLDFEGSGILCPSLIVTHNFRGQMLLFRNRGVGAVDKRKGIGETERAILIITLQQLRAHQAWFKTNNMPFSLMDVYSVNYMVCGSPPTADTLVWLQMVINW